MQMPSHFKVPLRWMAGLGATLVVGYLLVALVGYPITSFACVSETHKKISGLSGFDFEVVETDCDVLAKDASISVFVSELGKAKKVLLFKYGPAGVGTDPVISGIDAHTIQVSVPHISDEMFRRETFEGLSISYEIGIVDYPRPTTKKSG
jgi:hypothetical protein